MTNKSSKNYILANMRGIVVEEDIHYGVVQGNPQPAPKQSNIAQQPQLPKQ